MSSPAVPGCRQHIVDIDDAQLKTSCSLGIVGSIKRRSPFEQPERHNKMLDTLNWLSLFFDREPQDDAAAVAMKIDPPTITLYVALNKGAPSAEDRITASLLVDVIHNVQQMHESTAVEKLDVFLELLVKRTPQRIQRKIFLLNTLAPPSAVAPGAYLLGLVSAWQGRGHEETSYGLEQWASRSKGSCSNATDALKECIREIWSIDAQQAIILFPSDTEETFIRSVNLLKRIRLAISALVLSTFLSQAKVDPAQYDGPSSLFLSHIRERLERVNCYATGAFAFADKGLARLENALQRTDARQNIKVCFVGDSLSMPPGHGATYAYSGTPQELVSTFLQRNSLFWRWKSRLPQETESALMEAAQSIASSWRSGVADGRVTVRPRWHCELQLIAYLTKEEITVEEDSKHEGLIGTSKPPCETCDQFIKKSSQMNESRRRQWRLSETSGKAQSSWAIPDSPISSYLLQIIDDDRNRLLYRAVCDSHPDLEQRYRQIYAVQAGLFKSS